MTDHVDDLRPSVKLARCRCDPSHLKVEDCPSYRMFINRDENRRAVACTCGASEGYIGSVQVDCPVHDFPRDRPRHPFPVCHECREELGDADRAEVFMTGWPSTWSYGPFLVHADPCSQVEFEGHKKYELA